MKIILTKLLTTLLSMIVLIQKKLFTCCVSLNGEYGQKDICLGVPVVIGRNGWEKIIDYPLNEEEKTSFDSNFLIQRYLGLTQDRIRLNEKYKKEEAKKGEVPETKSTETENTAAETAATPPPTPETPAP